VFRDRSVLVVVPARGGSKGVPLKNIHPLAGRPLLAFVADVVHQLPWIDRAVVSTDHDAIAAVAEQLGLAVPYRRAEALSGDTIGDLDVLAEALERMEALDGRRYDVVVMLQPTSPLRTAAHVEATVAMLADDQLDAVWTVSPTDLKYHPLKQLAFGGDGRMRLQDDRGRRIVARQQLEPVFHRNGAAYAFTRRSIAELRTIMPERLSGVILHEPLVSIDDLEDFRKVERLLRARDGGSRGEAR
jgi:CMP-N,N'-diacetyllegionaminic acid synthase